MKNSTVKFAACGATLALLMLAGCAKPGLPGVKKMAAGKEYSGFLKDYSQLKARPDIGPEVVGYANPEQANNLRRYVGVIVDPVEIYLGDGVDESKIDPKAPAAIAEYFEGALKTAVGDAFPVVTEKGPLVMRLRAAVVGLAPGAAGKAEDASEEDSLTNAVAIGKVHIELELVDSETNQRIAAVVDKSALGAGAEVGVKKFGRAERYQAARQAFDEWAGRVREFLDREHELKDSDAKKADETYKPYGSE